jgi:hypothetical protein
MNIKCRSLSTLENTTLDNRFPFTGRLVQASMAWCRCSIKIASSTKPRLNVQVFDPETETWADTEKEVDAYYGLPTNEDMESILTTGMIVWCIYIHKTYFIVLAECQ